MLVPQYTIRRLMIGIAVCAVVALVIGQGIRGAAWALALTLALVVLAASLLVFAGVFIAVWLLSKVMTAGGPPQALPATVVYTVPPADPSAGSSGVGPAPVDQT